MKEKGKNKKGGFYIALCSCAVVVALVSYVGELLKDNDTQQEPENTAYEETETNLETEPAAGTTDAEYETVVLEPEIDEVIEPEATETAVTEEIDEFLPSLPAPGRIIAEYSNKIPVFYERLGDWRTHNGIDIEAAVGDDVYICETGVVEKIYKNNLGGCILVDHGNGYKSLYANLDGIDLVTVGDELHTGETIGRAGEASPGDITAVPHIHFEMYYEGKAIDPLEKIKIE